MDRLLIALDVETPARAVELAGTLQGLVGGMKIGSQLFTSAGPPIVERLTSGGHRVFLDLKFHDIPHQVAGAVESATRLGVWMLTLHASGGGAMMRAAVDAAHEESARIGRPCPLLVAVTVLTSLGAPALESLGVTRPLMDHVKALARLAQASGVDGVVCSPQEVAPLRAECGREFLIVTPGIRAAIAAGAPFADDQARTLSAAEAVAAGATYLVVGRPVLKADDPLEAAAALGREIAAALEARQRQLDRPGSRSA
jgi:orotidine-5'-phosphate decarboxylase